MNIIGFYVLFFQIAHALPDDVVSYKNYTVYKVSEKGFRIPKIQIPKLKLLNEYHEYDEMNNPYTIRSYLIPQPQEKDFIKILNFVGADYDVLIQDLEKEIEEEAKSLKMVERLHSFRVADVSKRYFSYDEMNNFLNCIRQTNNPLTGRPIAKVEPIGRSLQGRQMHLVKISADHDAQKPIIFFEAGIHAREWTAPAAALYIIYQLVENYTFTSAALIDVDYYVIPLSNPDGYEFSRKKDRMWRKTRSYHRGRYGVDGNRNFDFHWGERGTSGDPGSEIFRGPYPFSEAETRNIRDAGKRYCKHIIAFVSIHAFGPCIAYPWSYKKTSPAPQANIMRKIALKAIDAIKQYNGTLYKQGVSSTMLYEAAGGSDDYFKGVLGVDLSFTFELSSAKKMSFLVPASDIEGIVAEAFEGFKTIANGAVQYNCEKNGFVK